MAAWLIRLLHSTAARLRPFFRFVHRLYRPFADLRIILISLLAGIILLLGLDQGKDVVRGLVDSANATTVSNWREAPGAAISVFRWTLFLLACVWSGVNAWYWANLLYKTKRSAAGTPGAQQPGWYRWFRRLLGLTPIVVAIIAMPLSARHGFSDYWLGMLLFTIVAIALLIFFIFRNQIGTSQRLVMQMNEPLPDHYSLAIGDSWFILATLVIGIAMLILFAIPFARTVVASAVGPAAIAFGSIGCIIPFTSLLIWSTRDAKVPVILIGLWAFVLFSLVNDNHGIRNLGTRVTQNDRPTIEDALRSWERGRDPAEPIILVGAAGGASRAAYWTATVMRSLDDSTEGRFSDHVFAISSVSGGTLGAVGYAAWLADRTMQGEGSPNAPLERRRFVQSFFGRDYLGAALAGMLFPDLIQRLLPFPLFDDRAVSLEESFERGWSVSVPACSSPPCRNADRFGEDFLRIWQDSRLRTDSGRWVPIVLANGTSVETGKRIITAPIRVESDAFEDAIDFYKLAPLAIRASTAVLNSARFTLVSPPGRMMNESITHSTGRIIDGGYFENGGLETAYDIARYIRRIGNKRPILIVELINDDELREPDQSRHDGTFTALQVQQPDVAWRSPFLSEFVSIIQGLYETRSARGTLGAKRLSDAAGSGVPDAGLYSFDLKTYGNGWHTAMSWALSLGSLDAMDVTFNVTEQEVKSYLDARGYSQSMKDMLVEDLLGVIRRAQPSRDMMKRLIGDSGLGETSKPAISPSSAAKRQ